MYLSRHAQDVRIRLPPVVELVHDRGLERPDPLAALVAGDGGDQLHVAGQPVGEVAVVAAGQHHQGFGALEK